MNKGFSLIEIIVVLIILGVLAAIAVPNYFNWVRNTQLRTEAFAAIQSVKTWLIPCLRGHQGNETACFAGIGNCPGPGQWCDIYYYAASNALSPNFDYYIADNFCSQSITSGCDFSNNQGWYIFAQFPDGSGGIFMSGKGDDSKTVCVASGEMQGSC